MVDAAAFGLVVDVKGLFEMDGNLGAGLLTEVHDRIKAESPGA